MRMQCKCGEYYQITKVDVWRCPKCERIYVFEYGNHKAIKVYKLEE